MPFSKIIRREIEIAFAKHVQPLWARILKYAVLAVLMWLLWDSPWLWPVVGGIFTVALTIHFWYRYKTKGWTKSFGGWDYEKNKPGNT